MVAHININKCELRDLIIRVEHAIEYDLALSTDDLKLLLAAINTLCEVHDRIEEDNVTLHKLKKLLGMVAKSESRKTSKKPSSKNSSNKGKQNKKQTRKKPAPPQEEHHKITDFNKGDYCPYCHKGKLAKHAPSILLRVTGHAPFKSTKHIREQYRCNTCQEIIKATLPEAVLQDGHEEQMYGYSARALMVLYKFYSGMPYNHQSNLNDVLGCSITASTIFDQCQHVVNAVEPLFVELKKQAANAFSFDIDDTRNRILEQKPEIRKKRNGKGKQLRSGVYSSGLIAIIADGKEIILFETSLGHAGEHLDSILEFRKQNLPPPIVMSDALSSNTSTHEVIETNCNAHCRRNFYDLESKHPKEIEYLLDTYAVIWKNEYYIKQQEMNLKERLNYHKKHSLPVMEELKSWSEQQYSSEYFEENSAFGKAVYYLINHYSKLTQFCYIEGAKIDNNRMEERLKIIIRGRKTSYFYKTANGAEVANILTSIIATADVANINVSDYLQALQRYRVQVRENPIAWLPWNYLQTMSAIVKPPP